MALLHDVCPRCGSEHRVYVGQACEAGVLVWNKGFFCDHCQYAMEEDGDEPLDCLSRQALLDTEGVWSLQIRSPGNTDINLLINLRRLLGLDLKQFAALKKRLPGSVLTGTKGEVDYLRRQLAQFESLVAAERLS